MTRFFRPPRFYAANLLWWVMTSSIRLWVNRYMDQFETFKFKSNYGNDTYVSISYHSEYPDVFEDLDNPHGWG